MRPASRASGAAAPGTRPRHPGRRQAAGVGARPGVLQLRGPGQRAPLRLPASAAGRSHRSVRARRQRRTRQSAAVVRRPSPPPPRRPRRRHGPRCRPPVVHSSDAPIPPATLVRADVGCGNGTGSADRTVIRSAPGVPISLGPHPFVDHRPDGQSAAGLCRSPSRRGAPAPSDAGGAGPTGSETRRAVPISDISSRRRREPGGWSFIATSRVRPAKLTRDPWLLT